MKSPQSPRPSTPSPRCARDGGKRPTPPRSIAGRGPMPTCWRSCSARAAITMRRSTRASRPRSRRLQVILAVEAGRHTPSSRSSSRALDSAGPEAAALRKAFAVHVGDAVIAEDVIKAGTDLQVALGEQGFALSGNRAAGSRSRSSDHDRQPGLPVQPGPVAHYGTISVSGSPPFSSRHIQTIARFARGDPFKRSEINDLRRALIATGLVAVADVKVVPSADRQTVDVNVHLEPAPMRTVAGELGYGTGEGVRAEASWQHRNFFNPEGALTLRGVAGTNEQLCLRRVSSKQFHAPRPGVRPAGIGEQRRS